ncbi:MAG: SGNH/GDSL hydrolase family protein [Actinomycetota bacterium]|nr:SGNH/GDSL hydrolase family protein [Actinomycetota bacterium]
MKNDGTKTWKRYVAIGDSTTEGLDDPDGAGGYRGWADRFAEHVARAQGRIEYANLAVRGRLAREIKDQQLAAALALEPDLATCIAGMNDLIRPRFDHHAVIADLEEMHTALIGKGATLLTFTLPSPGPGMPLARLLLPRVQRYNAAVRVSAKRTGALVLDLGATPVASDPRLWSDDKLHANSLGHERIARGLAYTLGLDGFDDGWAEPLPSIDRTPLSRALLADLAWARTHLAPWIVRHVRGQSSGDDVVAKRPTPILIEADP